MTTRLKLPLFLTAISLASILSGCGSSTSTDSNQIASVPTSASPSAPTTPLTIVAGSENKVLEPIVQEFAQAQNTQITFNYEGSVDMMRNLSSHNVQADVVWPASSIWLDMGDPTKQQVKRCAGIYRTPVVFGVKKSVAQRLGWVGKPVTVDDILKASESGRLRFAMTSATQSNSGASAYLGYLNAFAGKPDVLTAKQLHDPQIGAKVKRILGSVNRTSGSSGWLKDLFLKQYEAYDAMVNYEAVIIEANQQLTKSGQEPLYAIYPKDGLAVADSTIGYVDHGDAAKGALYDKLSAYLTSPAIKERILATGRRTGTIGLSLPNAAPQVFNPAWGIQTTSTLAPIRWPAPDVIRQALDLYQESFRKPSFTVYCLDFSGSMGENGGAEQLKTAMRTLLDPQEAKKYLLSSAPRDVTVIIPFNSDALPKMEVTGNSPAKLQALLAKILTLQPDGGTNIYAPSVEGIQLMKANKDLESYSPAIVLMTDGQSNSGQFQDVETALGTMGKTSIPIYSITFGDADESQLNQLAERTSGRVFDGTKDLVKTFREVKGYN